MRYNFQRYLAAKKSIDDRSLNRSVLDNLRSALPTGTEHRALRVLELGSGIGTMIERLVEWHLLGPGVYIGVDWDGRNIDETRRRLVTWAARHAVDSEVRDKTALVLKTKAGPLEIRLIQADALEYCNQTGLHASCDLVIASAFMDLVDITSLLPRLDRLLDTNGLLYLTLNFDGETVLLPEIDAELDQRIIECYHASMDRMTASGRPVGGRCTGRKLLPLLQASGAEILSAGSSDWIVWPRSAGYAQDEAYFLHFIIHTIDLELRGHPRIDSALLQVWIRQRQRQIDQGKLTFIAKQFDCLARMPAGRRKKN